MMYNWIDHIVVRVKDLDQSIADYESKMGMTVSKGPDAQPHLGLRRAILPLGDAGRFIELAEPLGENSAIGRSLERFGEGIHLVAMAVDDMQQAIADLKQKGTQLIEMGNQVFIHPRETHGVLYQLIERK
jgi:methylmalonyl-CoA/ethylmalonyl-CoA epimerase